MGTQPRTGSVRRAVSVPVIVAIVVAAIAGTAAADDDDDRGRSPSSFVHAGSFFVDDNLRPGEPVSTPTSAEIVDVSDDGRTLVYTDGYTGRLGFVDVRRTDDPQASGALGPAGGSDQRGGPPPVGAHGRRDEHGSRRRRPTERVRRPDRRTPRHRPAHARRRSLHPARRPAGRSDRVAERKVRGDHHRERARRGRQRRADPATARRTPAGAHARRPPRPVGVARRRRSPVWRTSPRPIPSRSTSTSTAATRRSSRCRRTTTSSSST